MQQNAKEYRVHALACGLSADRHSRHELLMQILSKDFDRQAFLTFMNFYQVPKNVQMVLFRSQTNRAARRVRRHYTKCFVPLTKAKYGGDARIRC